MIYAQYLSRDLPNPPIDLKYVGVGLFLIGIVGNFYHHNILANLRKEGDKEYKIPQGGLFDLIICPHYVFEIFGYVGMSCISQTPYAFAFTLGTICYLMGRSYATREWYISKFGDKFPKDVKAFIPYVF
ncbi:putative 3-oxo-5-alpha-steroid 4-dehydrogenase (NADP(+)) [Helianthus debilis subsp. tardiflorus]